MKNNLILSIILISIITIRCNDDLDLDPIMIKKTKVLACVSLSKARMTQDSQNVDKLIEIINEQFNIKDGKNKLLSLSLVNCYSKVELKYALHV